MIKYKTIFIIIILQFIGCGTKYYNLHDYKLDNRVELKISLNKTEFELVLLSNYFDKERPYFSNFISDSTFKGPKISATIYNKGRDAIIIPINILSVYRANGSKSSCGIEIILKYEGGEVKQNDPDIIFGVRGVVEPFIKYSDDAFVELPPGDSVVLENKYDLFLTYMNISGFKPQAGEYQVSARYYNFLNSPENRKLKYGEAVSNEIEFTIK